MVATYTMCYTSEKLFWIPSKPHKLIFFIGNQLVYLVTLLDLNIFLESIVEMHLN